jgi:hypothetical protein
MARSVESKICRAKVSKNIFHIGLSQFTFRTLNLHFHCVQIDFLSEAPEARQRVAHGVSRGVEDQKQTKPRQGRQIRLFSAAPAGA